MQLRRFNKAGIDQFRNYIAKLNEDDSPTTKSLPAPLELLTDDALTELISPSTDCPDATFTNRLAAAEYLDSLLTPLGLSEAFNDVGLWSWLALRFFHRLRPLKDGIVILKNMGVEESRFVPSDVLTDANLRSKRYHRHLLRHPLQVVKSAGKIGGMCFLVQPVYRPGDFIEQFASRSMYSWYKEMVATLSELVVDRIAVKIRDNAPSSARRLHDVLNQFDCTWDLGFIAKDLLVPMLPEEFVDFPGRRKRR